MNNLTTETKIIIATVLGSLLLLIGGVFVMGKKEQVQQEAPKATPQLLIRDDSYRIATESAKVTLVEFGDFECPACGAAHPTVTKTLKDYNGKVNFVFRNFPLSQHTFAQAAAEAAEAAGEQGKYWEMYDKLYQTQSDWGENLEKEITPLNKDQTIAKAVDMFIGYAKDLGLDTEKFKQEITSNKFAEKIQRDTNDGATLGVNSTPTFYINGEKLVGVPSSENFKSKIDADLAK